MEDERNWFVGVDWASETHHVRVSDARGRKLGARAFAHSGEGLAAMAAWILEVTGAAPEAVFVAIEVPHGPVVESLMERGFRVHAINPKQLDRFRDRFSPAGGQINQVTTSPMPAEKIATTVIQPRTLVHRLFTRSPMMAGLLVMSRIRSRSGGVEKPWTIPDHTNAFMGLNPRKFSPAASTVKPEIQR